MKDGETTDDLFAFLTTKANHEVAQVHIKAMPVILRTPEEVEPYPEIAKGMQLPLPDGSLKVVNVGPKQDGAPIDPPAPAQASLF